MQLTYRHIIYAGGMYGVVRAVWCPVCHAAGGVRLGLRFISLWCQGPLLSSAWEKRLTIRLCGGIL